MKSTHGRALVSLGLAALVAACGNQETPAPLPTPTARPNAARPSFPTLEFLEREPARVQAALKAGGLQVCNELEFLSNSGYRFVDSKWLSVTGRAGRCHKTIDEMEQERSHGDVSIEHFTTRDDRDAGISVHTTEVVTGTERGNYNPAMVVWGFGNRLIIIGDGTTPDIQRAVERSLVRLDGATLIYRSFRGAANADPKSQPVSGLVSVPSQGTAEQIESPRSEVVLASPTDSTKLSQAALLSARGVVTKQLGANGLGVVASDLTAVANPLGNGVLVHVSRRLELLGQRVHVMWLVLQGEAYPLNGTTKAITPSLRWPRDAPQEQWRRTGIDAFESAPGVIAALYRE